jgi:hypothetical protein
MTEDERYRFDLNGCIVRRSALDAGELARINREIDALGVPPPADSIQSQRFSGLLEAGGLLRDLIDHPAVFEVVRELCGPFVRLDHAYGIVMAPGTSGLGLHGGAVPFDPAQYYLVRDGRFHTGLVAVQWALVDHPPGVGGFCCIPGSHTSSFPLPPGTDLDDPMVVEVPLHAGDVMIFTEAIVHGTLPWEGPHERRSVLYKYSPGPSSWANHPPCRDEVLPQLTERQRKLCQPPSVGYHQPV